MCTRRDVLRGPLEVRAESVLSFPFTINIASYVDSDGQSNETQARCEPCRARTTAADFETSQEP